MDFTLTQLGWDEADPVDATADKNSSSLLTDITKEFNAFTYTLRAL